MCKLDKTKAPQKIGIPSGFPRKTQVFRQNCQLIDEQLTFQIWLLFRSYLKLLFHIFIIYIYIYILYIFNGYHIYRQIPVHSHD